MKLALLLCAMLLVRVACVSQCASYTVPHFEGFQTITTNNQLPACWQATNLGTVSLTFTNTGSPGNYAAFNYLPAGDNYFFSPGFLLYPGVTYSVALWYKVSLASNSFTSLAIMTGPNQSTLGLTTLTVTSGPPSNTSFMALSGTVSVVSAGSYYFAVNANSNGSGSGQHLVWDDFSITMPCTLNSPTVNAVATPSIVCSEDSVTLNASGADIYSWSNSSTGSSIKVKVNYPSTPYTVIGTDTLTQCIDAGSVTLVVNPKPTVNAIVTPQALCAGKPVSLQGFGAQTYSWSFGQSGANVTYTPAVSSTYTLTGINQFSCSGTDVFSVTVFPLPTLTVAADRQQICSGETVSLTAAGAADFTWNHPSGFATGDSVTFKPTASTTYTVIGVDNNNCQATSTVFVVVSECQGVASMGARLISGYPNPFSDKLEISGAGNGAIIAVFDAAGIRRDVSTLRSSDKWHLDLREMPDGIYLLRIHDGTVTHTQKIIKTSH